MSTNECKHLIDEIKQTDGTVYKVHQVRLSVLSVHDELLTPVAAKFYLWKGCDQTINASFELAVDWIRQQEM